jgi:DDE superfamily endonuclease
MPFAPGNIEAGSFPAIRTLPQKPDPSSIFTHVSGRVLHWVQMIRSSAQTKRPVQARRRKQPTLPLAPNRPTYVDYEYFRLGAWTYLAAWDVHRARVFGRCEVKSGIAPVNRLVGEVMGQEPYKSARRVFWIMDNCSAHRGQKAANRLRDRWPNLILIHTPVHASWLNQVEIYFSIVQRKVLTPNDFSSPQELEQRLLAFQSHYER